MIFSELYSAYYNAVAAILSRMLKGECTERELQSIVAERAFGESVLSILPSLKSGKWQLACPDMTTALEHTPTMPMTTLQKRWLKAISIDPRVKLFGVEFPSLDDVEPLFTEADYCVYDKYSDGDPFEDEGYIQRFRVILTAIRQKTPIKFEMINRKGRVVYGRCLPKRLEYSEKDDKFRLVTAGNGYIGTVNLSRMIHCAHYTGDKPLDSGEREMTYDTATVKLSDDRNALERFMLHFAHFEKQAERVDGKHYLIRIRYARDDEPEMVIRLLSFGPMIEVVGADSLKTRIIEKLKDQKKCELK
ncbi:MAG: WYL domain-containing protein [Clostridia bacterium]|nr:WYL domain-containing protein [Clostridia bacterium]